MVGIFLAAVYKNTGAFFKLIFPAVIFKDAASFFDDEEKIRLEIGS